MHVIVKSLLSSFLLTPLNPQQVRGLRMESELDCVCMGVGDHRYSPEDMD